MDWPLYKVVFGLRHRRTFAFSSTSGRIIDVLASKDAKRYSDPFSFSQLAWAPDHMAFRISNKVGNYFLDCNIDGFVLTYHYMEKDTTPADTIKSQFASILNNSLHITEAKDYINRIGIMDYFAFPTKSNSAQELFKNVLKLDLHGIPDSFSLRFALKNVTSEGLVDSTKNDYSNVIFNISSDKNDKESTSPPDLIDFQVDYQIYFEPERRYDGRFVDKHFSNFASFMKELGTNRTLRFDGESHEQVLPTAESK